VLISYVLLVKEEGAKMHGERAFLEGAVVDPLPSSFYSSSKDQIENSRKNHNTALTLR